MWDMKKYLFIIFLRCSDSETAVINRNDVEQRTFIFEKGYLVKEWLRILLLYYIWYVCRYLPPLCWIEQISVLYVECCMFLTCMSGRRSKSRVDTNHDILITFVLKLIVCNKWIYSAYSRSLIPRGHKYWKFI